MTTPITPTSVLAAVQAGATNVWALAVRFEVPAHSPALHAALAVLMSDGSVVASDETNLYEAKLKATSAGATDV